MESFKALGVVTLIFNILLLVFIAPFVDQTTWAMLGGTFIGLLVAVPTVLLVVLIAQRRRDEQSQAPKPPAPPAPPQTTHSHTHTIERQFIVIIVPHGASRYEKCQAIRQLNPGITVKRAEQLLLAGKVKVVEQ